MVQSSRTNECYIHASPELEWNIERNIDRHIIGLLNKEKEAWRPNDAVTWTDVKEEVQEDRINMILEKVALHRGGENMKNGIDLTVAHGHYKGLIKAGNHRDAAALMTICTGACWSLARLAEEGIITSNEAKCPLCGILGADEDRGKDSASSTLKP